MTEPAEASGAISEAPVTGNHEIDRTLASLTLGDDVAEHPEALSAVLDVIQRQLAGPSVPQGLRPQS